PTASDGVEVAESRERLAVGQARPVQLGRGEPLDAAAEIRRAIELAVVEHEDLPVLREPDVNLDARHPGLDGAAHRLAAVFRRAEAIGPMSDDVGAMARPVADASRHLA